MEPTLRPIIHLESYQNLFPKDGEYDIYIRSSFKTFDNDIEESDSEDSLSETDSESELSSIDSEDDDDHQDIEKRVVLCFTSQLSHGQDRGPSNIKFYYSPLGHATPLGTTCTREQQAETALKLHYGILTVRNSTPISLTVNRNNQQTLNKRFYSYNGKKYIVLENYYTEPKGTFDLGNIPIQAFKTEKEYIEKYTTAAQKLTNMRVALFTNQALKSSKYITKKPLKSIENIHTKNKQPTEKKPSLFRRIFF